MLAQSQAPAQAGSSGDQLPEITVTGQRSSQDPQVAQVFGIDGIDPVMDALRSGRIPGDAEYNAMPKYTPQVGVPPPAPPVIPPPPLWFQILDSAFKIMNWIHDSLSAPPVCTNCVLARAEYDGRSGDRKSGSTDAVSSGRAPYVNRLRSKMRENINVCYIQTNAGSPKFSPRYIPGIHEGDSRVLENSGTTCDLRIAKQSVPAKSRIWPAGASN